MEDRRKLTVFYLKNVTMDSAQTFEEVTWSDPPLSLLLLVPLGKEETQGRHLATWFSHLHIIRRALSYEEVREIFLWWFVG